VIENWAPVDELEVRPKDNEWSRAQGLQESPVLLYSGTLGLKHNPSLLSHLAERFQGTPVRVVVISQGAGARWLADEKRDRRLDNLILLPYQPFEDLPSVLASADVLLTLLDPDAGTFSVPSKVLSYLCAGRPIVAAMPPANLGARTIEKAGAGVVVDPADPEAFTAAAAVLMEDPCLRHRCGEAARRYAEQTFDIDGYADRFEPILLDPVDRAQASRDDVDIESPRRRPAPVPARSSLSHSLEEASTKVGPSL
jgi:glycosyltransferase involved in cell wall biosynthesis